MIAQTASSSYISVMNASPSSSVFLFPGLLLSAGLLLLRVARA